MKVVRGSGFSVFGVQGSGFMFCGFSEASEDLPEACGHFLESGFLDKECI